MNVQSVSRILLVIVIFDLTTVNHRARKKLLFFLIRGFAGSLYFQEIPYHSNHNLFLQQLSLYDEPPTFEFGLATPSEDGAFKWEDDEVKEWDDEDEDSIDPSGMLRYLFVIFYLYSEHKILTHQ